MAKSNYIIPIFVPHAGCPHQCVFCNQKNISGQRALPTGDEVEQQITQYLQTIGDHTGKTVEVAFFGGSFTAIPESLQKELLQPARQAWQRGAVDYLRLSTRPDCLTRDNLTWLADWGVKVIELGVQSTDPGVLVAAKRGHSADDVYTGAALVKAMGFQLGLQMMLGLPGDTPEKALHTARELAGIQPDFVRIYPVLVIKGTELADMYQAGQYQPWDLLTTTEVCKDVLKYFTLKNIPVIRVGLQPSEQVSLEGDILAGPFHPALRELVESAWARERLEEKLRLTGRVPTGQITHSQGKMPTEASTLKQINALTGRQDNFLQAQLKLEVAPQDISIVRGQHNSNTCYFRQVWGIRDLKIVPNPALPRREMHIIG